MAAAQRAVIEQERVLRRQQRNARRHYNHAPESSVAGTPTQNPESSLLKSTSLYGERSVGQNGATWSVAESVRRPESAVLRHTVVRHQRRCASAVRAHAHRRAGSEFPSPAMGTGSNLRTAQTGGDCGRNPVMTIQRRYEPEPEASDRVVEILYR